MSGAYQLSIIVEVNVRLLDLTERKLVIHFVPYADIKMTSTCKSRVEKRYRDLLQSYIERLP